MNKILVNNQNYNLTKEKYELKENQTYIIEGEKINQELILVIPKNVEVKMEILARNSHLNLYIELEEGSKLIFHLLMMEGTIDFNINLNGEKAELISNINVVSKEDSSNNIQINHMASHTISDIKNHGFSLNQAKLVFDVTSTVSKNASKCISHQDNQIMEHVDSISAIHPNLYIDNYDVDATHSAYIGKFKEEELFYLMSRGITKEDSYLLLLKAFLTSCFEEEKDKYIDNIIKYYSC